MIDLHTELEFIYRAASGAPFFFYTFLSSLSFVLFRIFSRLMWDQKIVRPKHGLYVGVTFLLASLAGTLGQMYFNFAIGFVAFGVVCLKLFAVKRLIDTDRLNWSE